MVGKEIEKTIQVSHSNKIFMIDRQPENTIPISVILINRKGKNRKLVEVSRVFRGYFTESDLTLH